MEAFGFYLVKSAVWLTGFTLVFLVFLRNERYFRLNRAYLLAGIFASVVFPYFTWHYAVVLPSISAAEISIPELSEPSMVAVIADKPGMPFYWWLYIIGIAFLAARMVWQTGMVIRKLRRNGYVKNGPVKLVRTPEYSASFSFFSFVFVNPSTSDIEMEEILNHESGHIQKRHWFDLLLVELLRILQWFNPFAWVYAHLVRQNHEYLADEIALKRTSNPAIYRAALLNQMLGVPVISLANSFSYSLNKQRFKMMKKKIDSPFKKLKLLVVLPLMALIFYAFAKPEYIESPALQTEKVSVAVQNEPEITEVNDKTASAPITSKQTAQKEAGKVKGKVSAEGGKALQGATVVIRGTTVGTITDDDGNFALKDVPADAELAISYVGLKTVQIKPDFIKSMNVILGISTQALQNFIVSPFQPTFKIRAIDSENPPMILLDGKVITKSEMDKIKPDDIFSISVLKEKSATDIYGEQGKNGVILITTKGNASATPATPKNSNNLNDVAVVGYGKMDAQKEKKPPYTIVEQMPQYPGGERMMMYFLSVNTKYPPEAKTAGTEGTVVVNFLVSSAGKIENVKVAKSVHPALDAEAVRVVGSMPDWSPGKQNGKPVDVYYSVPIEFNLKSAGDKTQAAKINVDSLLNSSEPPLVILDNRVIKISEVKPDEIAQISVLKSESATRAYGEKGKNGVIIITSKQEEQRHIIDGEQAFVVVEQMPQFPGGENAMREFIQKTLKYPEEAKKNKVQATVIINFVIDKEGKIRNPRIMRGMPELNDEAMRILNSMPAWIPGKQGGKTVPVSYTIPVKFVLPSNETANQQKNDPNLYNQAEKTDAPFVVVEQMPQEIQPQFIDGERAFVVVEQMPQFPGGENAMREFIQKTLKYPEEAKKNKVQGVVIVNFVIDKEGKIRNPRIMRGKPELNEEALRVINSMPAWAPGKQGGKPVPVSYTIPVKFVLPATETETA